MCERGEGDINWKSCFRRERLPTKEGRLMLFGSWYFVFPDWECLFNSQKSFTMWDSISRKHLKNCRKKLLLQMYKMDIKSVLYPLPNRNSAMSWELSVPQLSRCWGCDGSTGGWSSQCWFSHGAIPEQGLSSAGASAREARLLQLLVPCQTHAGFASTCWGSSSLSHVQVWQQQGRDFEVNNTLCLWSLDASIYNQHSEASMIECICKCTYFLLCPAYTLQLLLFLSFFFFNVKKWYQPMV